MECIQHLNGIHTTFFIKTSSGRPKLRNGLGHRVNKIEGQSLEPVLPTTGLEKLTLNPTKRIDDVIDLTKQYHNLLQRHEDGQSTNFTYDVGVLSSSGADGHHNYLLDDLGSPVRLMDGYITAMLLMEKCTGETKAL